MLNYKGNFTLKLSFGDEDISIDPGNIKEFFIIQDMDRYLPSVNMTLIDADGILTHTTPFDRKLSRIHIQIGKDISEPDYNEFDFTVYRRNPIGGGQQSTVYDIRGLLTTDKLFAPKYCRGFNGRVTSTLNTLASELGCESVEASANLNLRETIIQPNWNNATFIDDLKSSLVGSDGEGSFQIYVKQKNGKRILFCKNLKSIFKQPIAYNFVINEEPIEDYYPAMDFEVFDNYKILGAFSSKKQRYQYFDYQNSEFVSQTFNADDMFSLSEYFLIDSDDTVDSNTVDSIGRKNGQEDINVIKNDYYNRLNSLVNMWFLTWGLPNLCPGDIVRIFFAQGAATGNLQSFQYSGYWMVTRVIHGFTGTHRTRVLVTRMGLDTDKDTTLLRAKNWRKK